MNVCLPEDRPLDVARSLTEAVKAFVWLAGIPSPGRQASRHLQGKYVMLSFVGGCPQGRGDFGVNAPDKVVVKNAGAAALQGVRQWPHAHATVSECQVRLETI